MFQKFFKKKKVPDFVEEWISFLRYKKNYLYSIRLNYEFKDLYPIKGYKYLILLSIDTKNISDSSLFYDIEYKISKILEDKFSAFFVGVLKGKDEYKLYFYSKNIDFLYDIVDDSMIQFPKVIFSASSEIDKKWQTYKSLLPTIFELERFKNEEKLLDFQKKGIKIGEKRDIFYFLSFKNEKIFLYVKEDIKSFGFKIIKSGIARRKNFKYAVKILKNTNINLNNLNNNTSVLCDIANKYNFNYEGFILD